MFMELTAMRIKQDRAETDSKCSQIHFYCPEHHL